MKFNGFTPQDFNTFKIDGLDARMDAIRHRIQPKFQVIGENLRDHLSVKTGIEMNLFLAKHQRRTVNPPIDTWLAIAADNRGYKKHPHFQLGLFDDHVFLWLAFIYELPNKKEIAQNFMGNFEILKATIPSNFVISVDHTKKVAIPMHVLGEQGLKDSLERFNNVKKSEFLIGQHIKKDDPILQNGQKFLEFSMLTFEKLIPLYHLVFQPVSTVTKT